ncbi:3-carboxy-cis,cis-muconate cycloisomerase [Pseudonocardia ailaonensis]|uniref:3-carboxy-cis,cis-muconate cycloisomerase n=1 Tax=Pseudonocardia ailaonensis TaxID=367279 RepID=A0ABN2MVN3_9PSEU
MTNLLGPLAGAGRVAPHLGGAAWIRALLDVEGALARAAAAEGLVTAAEADAAVRAVEDLEVDPAELAEASVAGGNPVIPLVTRLRAACDSPAVHIGATSQDVMDTALVLLVRRAAPTILDDLRGAADAAAALAAAHRDTPMIARTLGQQATPTTFGLVAAGWCAGLDAARGELAARVEALPVQLGGAAGTLAGSSPGVADTLAALLGLAPQGVPWHTERTRIGTLAAALGVAAGACAKPATDVVLLSATEVGEVAEGAPGGSSAMPHKRNPIAAITARAAAGRAPGLVATLLAAMAHEHQRAAGPWHTEWPALTDLMIATGGAADRLRTSLEGLRVFPDTMARTLGDRSDAGHAAALVDRVLAGR